MENKHQVTIVVLPEFGDAYEVSLSVPDDRDDADFINDWMNDNTINVQAWEFSKP